jgi:DNA-binding CsgD family transcriptional regulator
MTVGTQPRYEGPIRLTRRLLKSARLLDIVSVTYYYSKLFQSPDPVNLYLHFETGKKFSRYDLADEHKEVLGRCHEYVIDNGKPLILSAVLPLFQSVEPKLTKDVMDGANKLGVFDQYMIPVYGPFKINGVISFGFAETIDPKKQEIFEKMISLATVYHYQMVEHFGEMRSDIDLSQRENEVLTWIAKGKSGADVATILGISASSVDTYTRRIFEKMGVNDRVSAAISGVVEGLIKPN